MVTPPGRSKKSRLDHTLELLREDSPLTEDTIRRSCDPRPLVSEAGRIWMGMVIRAVGREIGGVFDPIKKVLEKNLRIAETTKTIEEIGAQL